MSARILRQLLTVFFIFVLCCTFSYAQQPAAPIADAPGLGAAGCFLHTGQHVLLVKDVWSKRYSLPGGGARPGESLESTAQRETLEETGISVTVQKVLVVAENGFRIYECLPVSGSIEALADGIHILPPLRAFNEISEAVFRDPSSLSASQWRFQSQKSLVIGLGKATNPLAPFAFKTSENTILQNAPSYIRAELKLIQGVQENKNYLMTGIFKVFTFFGSAPFVILLLTAMGAFLWRRQSLDLFFLYLSSSMLHGILKELFQGLRPFHYQPSLQLAAAEGFGFPSGHTQAATVVWGWLIIHGLPPKYKIYGVFILVLCGLSRVVLGVHFPHDVLGAWTVGSLVLIAYEAALRFSRKPYLPAPVWGVGLPAIAVTALLVRPHPDSVGFVCLLIGVCLGRGLVHFLSPQASELTVATAKNKLFILAVFGMIAIEILSRLLFPQDASFYLTLRFLVLKFTMLGVWLSSVALFQHRKFYKSMGSST